MSYDSKTRVNDSMIDMLIPSISEIDQLHDTDQIDFYQFLGPDFDVYQFQNLGFI